MSLGALASSEGRPSEALALYDRIATAQLKEDALADWAGARALVLERLGRADDARRQLREALARKDLPAAKRARLSEYLQGLRGA